MRKRGTEREREREGEREKWLQNCDKKRKYVIYKERAREIAPV